LPIQVIQEKLKLEQHQVKDWEDEVTEEVELARVQ
jgi:hypothetical protein